ncbi:MAG TPA: hypothetical protein VJ373_01625 [Desulfatiglandales bacterium]|nr:hypothetical protein [Desulfatiglandales bacterium]
MKNEIETYEQNEVEALQALEQAREALAYAVKKDNSEAREIASQAVALAQEALSDVRRQKERDKTRLTAIEGALRQEGPAKGFGITAIIKGKVFKKTKTGRVPFDGTTPIVAGDIMETDDDGFLEVVLSDHSYISMGANTSIEVSELDSDEKLSLYNIIRREFYLGKLNIKRKCYLPGRDGCWVSRYSIVPKVSIGVRGTEFNIEQNPDGGTTLIVLEGTLEVTDTNADKPVEVNAMEQLTIAKDGSIQGPISIETDSIQRWWETAP